MKKIYVLVLSVLFVSVTNAQTILKVANPKKKLVLQSNIEKIKNPISTQTVTGSVSTTTQYVAGTTMSLNLVLTLSNLDEEYVDSLAITFPTGITPVSSPNNPFSVPAGTQPAEALNGITGQTISWGDNDNNYGGIETPAPTATTPNVYNFTISVTIDTGLIGNQTITYHASGDQFPAIAGPMDGTFTILPAGTIAPNLAMALIQPFGVTQVRNCNYGLDSLITSIINLGSTTESNYSVSYSVNGAAAVVTVVPGPIAPGDTVFVLLPVYNFSASNVYNIVGYTSLIGDVNLTNDTAKQLIVNSVSVPLTSATYTNGAETSYEQNSILIAGSAAPVTGISTGTFHTGTSAYFTTVSAANPAGTYEVLAILPCMDVLLGETYRISYWKRTNAALAGNGQTGVFTDITSAITSAFSTVLKAYSATTLLSTWIKDSVDFTATANETRYFAIGGRGTVTASSQMNCRLDDIAITKVNTFVGVKQNSISSLSISSNPSNGLFTINTVNSISSLKIYNILGEVVYTNSYLAKGTISLNLSNLPKASYFIKLVNGVETITKKIVIE